MAQAKVMLRKEELQPFKVKDGSLVIKAKDVDEGIAKLYRWAKLLQEFGHQNSIIVGYTDEQIAEGVDATMVHPSDIGGLKLAD